MKQWYCEGPTAGTRPTMYLQSPPHLLAATCGKLHSLVLMHVSQSPLQLDSEKHPFLSGKRIRWQDLCNTVAIRYQLQHVLPMKLISNNDIIHLVTTATCGNYENIHNENATFITNLIYTLTRKETRFWQHFLLLQCTIHKLNRKTFSLIKHNQIVCFRLQSRCVQLVV